MTSRADQAIALPPPPPPLASELSACCWDCGYSLRALEQCRCPECGRSFNPADPASMNLGLPMGPLARRLLRPAAWYGPYVCAYVVVAMILSVVFPTNRWLATIVFVLWWLLLGVPYLFRRVLRYAVVKRYRQPTDFLRVDDQMMRRVGRVMLYASITLFVQLPLYAALFLSMPWLNALGRERYERTPYVDVNVRPLGAHQYGVFRVAAVRVEPNGAYFDLWQLDYQHPNDLMYAPGREVTVLDYAIGFQLTPSWSIGG